MELKPIPQCLRTILESHHKPKSVGVLFDTAKKYNGTGASTYGQAALVAECERVANAPSGTRNNTLNTASFTIGQLVAGGELEHGLAFGRLLQAAIQSGLTEDEADKTANSGLIAGMNHPRSSKPLDESQADIEETLSVADCPDPALLKGAPKRQIEIPSFDTSEDLQIWVIDNAEKLASLDASELAKAKIELIKRGVPKGFLDKDLSKILKEKRDDQESLWEKCIDDMENLGYSFRMNQLDDCIEVNGERINDGIDAQIIMEMYDKGWNNQGEGGSAYIRLAWTAQAHQHRYHPVKDFLNSLKWDGLDWIGELEQFVKDKHPRIVYSNGDSISVFASFLKRWGIGAVGKVLGEGKTRVQNPMLVLDGAQGAGKSTLVRFLCPMSDLYFIESHIEPDAVDHLRYLATKLVWEVGELGATTRKADRESLKAFLTKQDVTFRVPFAKHPVIKPALASFIGTINPEVGFLTDPTGHRRFLPVEIESIDFRYAQAVDPLQLWAQFVALYRASESEKLTAEEKVVADTIRLGHEIEDQYAGFVTKFYNIELDKAHASALNLSWSATTTDVVEQLAMNGVTGVNTTNIGMSLVKLGLIKARQRVNGVQETRWYGLSRNGVGFRVRAIGG